MDNQEQKETEIAASVACLLQPEDSKRVADAIIAAIDDGEMDMATATASTLGRALTEGLPNGLGDAIVEAIARQVNRSIEYCIGSKEMGDIVRSAISDGIISRPPD